MKFLFHRYGCIVEPDIIEAFKELGIDAIEDNLEIDNKVIDPEIRIKTLAEAILLNSPDFVFSINFFPYISDICEKLNVLYVALSVDCPVLEIYSSSIRNKCNRIFLFDYAQYETIVNENPDGIFYLPLAANVERWDKIVLDDTENKYLYDVSFIGSLYTEKSQYRTAKLNEYDKGYMEGVLAAGTKFNDLSVMEEVVKKEDTVLKILKNALPQFFEKTRIDKPLIDIERFVATNNIIGFELTAMDRVNLLNTLADIASVHVFTRSDTSMLHKSISVHGGVSTHTEMPRIFKQSKININPTMRCIQTGLPQRIWDICGCGALLLTNYQAEIPEYFEIGEDILCYENSRDCAELVKYYLNDDEAREQIALNAYNKVKKHHTYTIRMASMLKMVFDNN